MYHFQYAIDLTEDLVVPEPQHDKSRRFKCTRASLVALHSLRVLTAIEFDDEHAIEANEIQNEITVRMLPAKLATVELTSLQPLPKRTFAISGRVAQLPLQFRPQDLLAGLTFHRPSMSRPSVGRYGSTTFTIAGTLLPMPRTCGWYMSSTNGGGIWKLPGDTARTR